MKTILLLLLINSFILADSLLIRESAWANYSDCITEHYYKNNHLFFITSDNQTVLNKVKLSDYDVIDIQSGYIFEDNKCLINYKSLSDYIFDSTFKPNYTNLTDLGLSQNDFNLMMAFSGILISFLFLFGLFRWI